MVSPEKKRHIRQGRREALWEGLWFLWVMACWYGWDNWGGWIGVILATLATMAVFEVIVRIFSYEAR